MNLYLQNKTYQIKIINLNNNVFDPAESIENKIILAKKQLKDLSSNFQSNFSNIEIIYKKKF